jgi:hypothetical protein
MIPNSGDTSASLLARVAPLHSTKSLDTCDELVESIVSTERFPREPVTKARTGFTGAEGLAFGAFLELGPGFHRRIGKIALK